MVSGSPHLLKGIYYPRHRRAEITRAGLEEVVAAAVAVVTDKAKSCDAIPFPANENLSFEAQSFRTYCERVKGGCHTLIEEMSGRGKRGTGLCKHHAWVSDWFNEIGPWHPGFKKGDDVECTVDHALLRALKEEAKGNGQWGNIGPEALC